MAVMFLLPPGWKQQGRIAWLPEFSVLANLQLKLSHPFQKLAVYLPAGYREHWVNPKGEVILSTEVGFNPNPGDASDWRRMERRDPIKT